MTENSISAIGLVLCMAPGILHSVEAAYPLLARRLANYVLPLFEPGLPRGSKQLTGNEQIAMLDAALFMQAFLSWVNILKYPEMLEMPGSYFLYSGS